MLQPPLANLCTTVGAGAKTLIHIGRGRNGIGIQVRGATNYEKTWPLTVRDPVLFFGQDFLFPETDLCIFYKTDSGQYRYFLDRLY